MANGKKKSDSQGGKTRIVYRNVKKSAGKAGRKAKQTLLSKAHHLAMPGMTAAMVYAKYTLRGKELFTAGLIPEASAFKALQYDLENFNGSDAMGRLKTNAGEIIAPFLAAGLIKDFKPLGKFSGVAAELARGFGAGVAVNTILDPPIEGAKQIGSSNAGAGIKVISSQETAPSEMQSQFAQIQPQIGGNPYL